MTSRRTMLLAALAALSLPAMQACTQTATRESTSEYIDDATITARVKAALAADPDVKAYQVSVETYRGVVQLSGFVDSEASVKRAGEVARAISGVRSVQNEVRVKPAS